MKDEQLYRASLRVASSILTGLASALLLEIPLARTLENLTYNTLFCILNTIVAIYIERYLEQWSLLIKSSRVLSSQQQLLLLLLCLLFFSSVLKSTTNDTLRNKAVLENTGLWYHLTTSLPRSRPPGARKCKTWDVLWITSIRYFYTNDYVLTVHQ